MGRKFVVTMAATSVAAIVLAPSNALASGIGGFSVRPATFDPADPATRAYFKPFLSAGRSFTGSVVVTNSRRQPLDLLAYPVDGLTGVTSGSVYANRQDPLRKAGRWLRVSTRRLTVPPLSQRQVPFTVTVPRSAKPGDHLAGVAFEDAHPQKTPGRFSVTEVFRAIVGVEVRVPGPAKPQIQLGGFALKPLPGTKLGSVIVQLANAGRLLCKPQLKVSVRRGGSTRAFARQLDTILPGDTIQYPFPWPWALRSGQYNVTARASSCGRVASLQRGVHLGRALAGPKSSAVPAPRASGTPWWVIPLTGVGGIGAGLGVALFAVRRGRPV